MICQPGQSNGNHEEVARSIVSNGSNFLVWFWFQVGTKPGQLQLVSIQRLLLNSQRFSLQLCTWVLIRSWDDWYMNEATCWPHISAILWFAIRSIFVESLWKIGHWAGCSTQFHSDSTDIDPIGNRKTGDERARQTAYFMYRLCCDTMRIEILNLSESCGTHWMELQSSSNLAPNPAVVSVVLETNRNCV